ncbi:hypothetical protein SAMN05444166_4999 [Singulisphaera sp. GP187]|uniref:tetratricopeptide repeat protein n=1 Tax=Singulisphaera sp. GP187 TaxID=1882752 RepID=UPI000927231E|nr:tetratricopeptide repeat protein [Singulisphaera sp. GP187]SIO46894.1 hypothetical protein SAMN05444166_4999 [Singulisphaera sp. GP187]
MSSDQRGNPDSHDSSFPEPGSEEERSDGPRPDEGVPPALLRAGPSRNSGGRRSGFKRVVLATLLLVVSAAGYSIAQSLREADWLLALLPRVGGAAEQDQGAAAPAPVPAAEDPSERCELQVFANQPGGETIVFLTEPGRMTEFRAGYYGNHSRLAREIVRQALLLAAREALNVPVRDASIGDPAPNGQPTTVIEVAVLCPREKTSLRLSRGQGENREILFERTLRDSEKLNDYPTLVKNAEVAARDGLPEVLTKVGVKGKAVPKKGDGRLPAGLEEQLLKMSFVSQFAAVRQLHETIRTDGSSPWRLHGLARGYANLGVLTEFQWDAAGQAYKARGMLYAQRDVAARPGAPVARWNRAYAAAMAGVHIEALDDLEAATRFAKGMAEALRPAPPPWVELVDAHCHYDAEKLAKLRNGSVAELGALLYVMTVEHPSNTDVALCAAREAIVANPECFRAHDALCEVSGVANLHGATTAAPQVLDEVIPGRIADLPGVPAAVRKTVQDDQDEVALTRALDAAADPSLDRAEPSWGALARMIRETRFVCTYRRLDFMANLWRVPTGEYWVEARPLVAEHRFRPFLETYVPGANDRASLIAFGEKLDTTDLGPNSAALQRKMTANMPPGTITSLFGVSVLLSDWNARDLSQSLLYFRESRAADYAHKLLSVSPNSAYAMAMLVEYAWDEAEKKVDGWRKQVGDHPSLIGALARRYDKLDRMEEAEVLLKRYIELSPDPWAYRLLANRAKALGNEARWIAILDDYLAKEEDHGLDHAKVRVEIAEALMAKGRFDEARPYADAAAETWAGWAMQTAQKCAEGQEDWDDAEKWAYARAERYPHTSAYDWLDFCVRTGHGHLKEACDFTLAVLNRTGDRAEDQVVVQRASLLIAKGEPGKTFDSLQQLIKAESDNTSGHQVACVTLFTAAGLAGDQKLLDTSAEQFIDQYKTASPKFTAILAKIREAIAKGDPDALDQKGVDTLIEETPSAGRIGPALVVAAYYAGAKQHEKAKPYWEQAAEKGQSFLWWRVIADSHLRARDH